jgi:hypothetical protein
MAGAVAGVLDLWGQTHDTDERPGEVVDLGAAPIRWHNVATAEVRAEAARVAAERVAAKAKIEDLQAAVPAVGTPVVLRWTDPDAGRKTRVRKTEGAIEAVTTSGIRIRSVAGYRDTCTWASLLAQQANLRSPDGALLLGGPLRRDAAAAGV